MKIVYLLLLLSVFGKLEAQFSPIGSGVFHLDEIPVKKEGEVETRKIAEGRTNELSWLNIHTVTLIPGTVSSPSIPADSLEKLIIIKEGRLTYNGNNSLVTLGEGSIMLLPPGDTSSYQNNGTGPLTYYLLQFRSAKPMNMERSINAGGALFINRDTIAYTEKNDRGTEKFFNRPTAMCENYEMHITTLKKKGASHSPHQHVDTEIILVISGEVEMVIDGLQYKGVAGDLFIAESGKLHGVANAMENPCSYFAFKWR